MRSEQAGLPIGFIVIDQRADECSVLSSLLRTSDRFCVRLTCKEAWRRVVHKTLTTGNIVAAALAREALGHAEPPLPRIPLLSWCFRDIHALPCNVLDTLHKRGFHLSFMGWSYAFRRTAAPSSFILVGLAACGHEELALALLDDPSSLAVAREVFGTTARALSDGCFIRAARLVESNVSRWRTFPVLAAVVRGHLASAQWTLAGYRWSEHDKHMMYAAGTGSNALLVLLVSQGCPLDP